MFTTMVMVLEAAGFDETHRSDDVNVHETISPFTGVYVKELRFVPAFVPFTFHWYAGDVPPFTGVAVKVTGNPASTGFVEASMDMVTGKRGVTVMVTVLEVAGFPVIQDALEVRMQVTWSLLDGG